MCVFAHIYSMYTYIWGWDCLFKLITRYKGTTGICVGIYLYMHMGLGLFS